MSGIMKFNRIMAVIFGFLVGFGGLALTIIAIFLGKKVNFDIFNTLFLSLIFIPLFLWGVKELRSKEMTPISKETKKGQTHKPNYSKFILGMLAVIIGLIFFIFNPYIPFCGIFCTWLFGLFIVVAGIGVILYSLSGN